MFRLPDVIEAMDIVAFMTDAASRRSVVELEFLGYAKEAPDKTPLRYAKKHGGHYWFADRLTPVFGRRPLLSNRPKRRRMEVVAVEWTTRETPVPWSTDWESAPYADVIQYGPNGPVARRIRLDHVIIRPDGPAMRVLRRRAKFTGTGLDPTIKRGENPLNPAVARR